MLKRSRLCYGSVARPVSNPHARADPGADVSVAGPAGRRATRRRACRIGRCGRLRRPVPWPGTRARTHTRTGTNPGTNSRSHAGTNSRTDTNSNAHTDTNANSYPDSNSHTHADAGIRVRHEREHV
jgi:hypothetical protein